MKSPFALSCLPPLLLAGLLVFVRPLSAQMQTGEQMQNFGAAFGVKTNQRSYPFDAVLVGSSVPGNILFPGEQPKFTIQIVNNANAPLAARGRVHVIAYGTRGIPGDIWLPVVYRVQKDDVETLPVEVSAGPRGFADITVAPRIPERFGAYALVVELDGVGSRFATSVVRTFPATTERLQYPKMSLDRVNDDVLNRLGVQAIRLGVGYVAPGEKGRAAWLAQLHADLTTLNAKKITVLLVMGAGDAPMPLGRPRPHLDDNGVMLATKSDMAWLPSVDPEFQKDITDICDEYGWPKGPVTAISLWNEPWDGISISGWGADSLRYREIYTAMAHGVEAARKQGADVLLGGADSSSNTLDKFFSDGSDTFLKWLDVATVHYQGLDAPVLNKAWANRAGGRVRVWDTESWTANTDDRVATVLAADRAAGYDRSMGIYGGNIAQPTAAKRRLPDGKSVPCDTVTTWSVAASIGAAQHFIGERDFKEFLFQKGLPWIFVFDGLHGRVDDGTVVICGDLGEAFGADKIPFRNVRGLREIADKAALRRQLDALPAEATAERAALQKKLDAPGILSGGKLSLPAQPGFQLYDDYGNPVPPAADGMIEVPLDNRGFYVRADGSPGSFARLRAALRTARIDGYEPLEVIVRDPVAPLDQGGTIGLSMTNILDRPVSGALSLEIPGLALDYPKSLAFAPHETKEVAVKVAAGAPRADNSYPLSLVFDAGADGRVPHDETIHVDYVARRTIKVDGDLGDWKGVLPQTVRAAGDSGPTMTEAAWLPFEKYPVSTKSGFATAWLAYDDNYFYFAARIADDTPDPGTFRFATLDDDQFFYPQKSYELDASKTLQKKEEIWDAPSRDGAALRLPGGGPNDRSHTIWNSTASTFALDMKLPEDRATRVAFYFVDPDPYESGRRRTLVQVTDAKTGKVLARQRVEKYGFGTYAVFAVAGDVRVLFQTESWLPASLSGVFLDAAKASTLPGAGARAKFLGLDDSTGANWDAKYGKDGYDVFGAAPNWPAYARVTAPENVVLTEHDWPAGVRRFSYRKRPVLPSGNAPKFDNVQIAFGVRAPGEGSMLAHLPGVMPGFVETECTDYEYALNKVAEAYGGGTEIWRLLAPGMPRKSFYPREPKSPFDGAVQGGKLVITHTGNTRIVEAAIPWGEIPLVWQAVQTGKPVRFSFRVNDNGGPGMELAIGRSASWESSLAFHADWVQHWANEIVFGFEKTPDGKASTSK